MSMLAKDGKMSSSFTSTTNRPITVMPLSLVAKSEVRSLLDLFFAEMEWTLPIMERPHVLERLPILTVGSGHPETGQFVIDVGVDNYPLTALLCIILATAEVLSSSSTPIGQGKIPGQAWYIKMQDLLQHFRKQDQTGIDLIRCHTLRSFYLLAIGKFQEASEAIGAAVQLAAASRLNIGEVQLNRSHGVTRDYKRLWWSICVMDQQICRIGGTPYWIHDPIPTTNKISPLSISDDVDARDSSDAPDSSDAGLVLLQALYYLTKFERKIWDHQISSRSDYISDREIAATIDSELLQLEAGLLPFQLARSPMGVDSPDGMNSRQDVWRHLIISNVG